MGIFSIFTDLKRAARKVGSKADVSSEQAKLAAVRLKQLDDRLKQGLISQASYDKLARAERAAMAYLAAPVEKDQKLATYSRLMDLLFWSMAIGLVTTTLVLKYKYGKKPSKPLP